jgi:hypothetical protein
VNGGQDFDQELLDEIYGGIKWVDKLSGWLLMLLPPSYSSPLLIFYLFPFF